MSFLRPNEHPDELLSASLTGDLSDAERALLDAHLPACPACRETLAAFAEERRLISGMHHVLPPRDLGARVRTGIESGRLGSVPWWRRPGPLVGIFASAATVAAGVLAFVVFSNLPGPPVGRASPTPSIIPAASEPIASSEPTLPASAEPTPIVDLGTGDLGYISVRGGTPEEPQQRLIFIDDTQGNSVSAAPPTGEAIVASLSPTGEWLAYTTAIGLSGANQVWALHLTDGQTLALGCSFARPFTDRLAWSPDGTYLAYTLAAVDMGPSIEGCDTPSTELGSTDVYLFEPATMEHRRLTESGNAYAADFAPTGDASTLFISFAGDEPQTAQTDPATGDGGIVAPGMFMPLLSPAGDRALFWQGQMAKSEDGTWEFVSGGLPQVGEIPEGSALPSSGTPLFDLQPVGGEAFAYGRFTWSDDGSLVAFWDGAWTGQPQSADGTYPSLGDAYVGGADQLPLTADSRLPLDLQGADGILDVVFEPGGSAVVVTLRFPAAGDLDPAHAELLHVPLDGGDVMRIGGTTDRPAWDGPAVFGPKPLDR